jgi:hypothetical protein
MNPKNYEIALSFAGEDRAYVEMVADGLRGRGVTVFYDDYEKVEIWGKNLYEHLISVYSPSVRGVALAPRGAKVSDILDASALDFTSRVRSAGLGRIVVLQNIHGFFAALEILEIKDDTRGDSVDELRFKYWILKNGGKDFQGQSV